MYNKLFIIDGSYYLNRVMSTPRLCELHNDNDIFVGGVFGFLRCLESDLEKISSYFPVVVFDKGISERRTSLYPEYKRANEREQISSPLPEEICLTDNYGIQYKFQRELLVDILTHLGIPVIISEGYEGDDLIYLLTTVCEKSIIATHDKDMWQLIRDNCSIYLPLEKRVLTKTEFKTLYKSIDDFILSKVVIGDKSDNIPSCCVGIGEAKKGSFLDLLNLYRTSLTEREWDFNDYPETEQALKTRCEQSNIPYSKAFLNFDKNQFNINMELVDLYKVEMNPIIQNTIDRAIQDCRLNQDLYWVVNTLSSLQIQKVDIDKIACAVSKSYFYLYNRNTLF